MGECIDSPVIEDNKKENITTLQHCQWFFEHVFVGVKCIQSGMVVNDSRLQSTL